jgi:putative chitinase
MTLTVQKFDRKKFFDAVRPNPFPGALTQQQVDGMNGIIDAYERDCMWPDLRWFANMLAQTKWETSSTMWPVEEYGKGGNADYAKIVKETGYGYWGRGLLQLTWADNYKKADAECGWTKEAGTSCYWNPPLQLKIEWSAPTAFRGMSEGWFRSSGGTPNTLSKYFNDSVDDPFNAREIVNGDKNKVPSWASGAKVGDLIAADHRSFLAALQASLITEPDIPDEYPEKYVVRVNVETPEEVRVIVGIKVTGGSNGEAESAGQSQVANKRLRS